MTIPVLKIRVQPKAIVKGKMDVRFPGLVTATSPILLDKTGGNFVFSLDMDSIAAMLEAIFEPIHAHVDQEITSGASAVVATNAETVRVNKTVGSATTLTMPPANTMLFPVLIVDWKGDAGTNSITILPNGSETIQGQSSWIIAANGASVCLRPIAGVGFAL
jgi:hypothetical protein